MEQTAEQRAWACGRDTGVKNGRAALDGRTIGLARADTAPGVSLKLRAAFLNGYGHGIAEAAGRTPGHHLASVVMDSPPFKVRTELVPDHREVPPIPLDELAELNPGMGPKGLHRLQAMEQLLAEDDQANGIEPDWA